MRKHIFIREHKIITRSNNDITISYKYNKEPIERPAFVSFRSRRLKVLYETAFLKISKVLWAKPVMKSFFSEKLLWNRFFQKNFLKTIRTNFPLKTCEQQIQLIKAFTKVANIFHSYFK